LVKGIPRIISRLWIKNRPFGLFWKINLYWFIVFIDLYCTNGQTRKI